VGEGEGASNHPTTTTPLERRRLKTLTALVPFRRPFSFALALAYLRGSPSTIVEQVDDSTYRRVIRLAGGPLTALLTVQMAPDGLGLEATLTGTDLSGTDRNGLTELVRHIFSTDDDLTEFHRAIEGDPAFQVLAERWAGLHPVIIPDLFETVAWAIIGQQINIAFAATCKRALVNAYGTKVTVGEGSYLLFPEAAVLAEAREADLVACQLSRQKIRYIVGLSREIAEGRLDLEEIRGLPAEVARDRLESILGIGRWTAEYVLMRGIGHRDVIPAGDGALRRIIGETYGFGRLASEAQVRTVAEAWTGWRGYAAFYWWFTMQQDSLARRLAREREQARGPRRRL
jgi:DNA-3-methyladenine glycosylase II